MLRATTACTFSTSQLPKVVRSWCVLYILTWKCASRHNGVQFFISHLASWLRTRRFSEPTFRPSGAPNHWKNTVFRDLLTFSHICIFFLLIFSLLTLLTSAFQLSILSEVSLLNFLRIYIILLVHFDYINNDSFWRLFKWTSRYDMINILWRPLRCQSGFFQPNLGWNMELGFLHMASWENLEFKEWLLISKIFVYYDLVLNFPVKHYCFRVCGTSTSGLHEMRLALAAKDSRCGL